MRRVVLLVLLASLASACGARSVEVGPHDMMAVRPIGEGTRQQVAEPSPTADAAPVAAGSKVAGPKTAANGKTPRGLPSGRASHSNIPLTVRLSSECVTPGGTMSATAETVKDAGLGFTAAYPDNTQVPDFTFVPRNANPTGTFTWTWTVKPTIPPGDALLTVVAYTDNEHSATYDKPFRIARAC